MIRIFLCNEREKEEEDLYLRDVYYFEYCNRKIKIVSKNKICFCKDKTIGDIAKEMLPYGFIMSHQSYVVNMNYIEKIMSQSLLMKNGDIVCLAQKRASTVRKRLLEMRNFDIIK